MMIEADVSAGEAGQPIMAHPPDTQSDLSLDLFLETVLTATEGGARKGIKLDFKSLDILQPSLEALKRLEARLEFPVWLNADILRGPGGGEPVSAEVFLQLCSRYLPSATLSTGNMSSQAVPESFSLIHISIVLMRSAAYISVSGHVSARFHHRVR